ncbi:glycosylhydrolase-like jelly roll fold domain-containing protein [Nocardioides sp. Soil796]|uniref:glycosylhydrolase-like jelly roll fold domain-containing protein n=1 Tax=Nocardioides sp. Soil796 TaxID=1736412 RepID=UPI00070D801A|nr:glycosyl hydrolase [Nocardioides sp. Soil796]KRF16865.1 hypothetical protein ASH02_02045 [Nocardioides sp. Soil796]
MMRKNLVGLATAALLVGLFGAAQAEDSGSEGPDWDDTTGRLDPAAFAEPPSTSRPHAFWFWNGELTEAELDRQLDEMQANGVEEFFIHPRQGLGGEFGVTENDYYLSTDYFDKVEHVVEQAADRGMKAWLYDDLNWPSGFAGGRTVRGGEVDGRTIEANPTYVPWYLTPIAADVPGGTTYDQPVAAKDREGPVDDELVAAVAYRKAASGTCVTNGEARGVELDGSSARELEPQDGRISWTAPAGDGWCVVQLVQRPLLNYHPDLEPDEPYVDMLNPKVTEKFIDITHESYAARVGEQFGDTIPGIFNDEPGFYNNFPDGRGGADSRGSVAWTPGFRDYLTHNAGHDLTRDLAALWYDTGSDTTKVRVAYQDALSDRYNEAHTVPLARWADDHGIALISNPLVEEDLGSHRLIQGGSWFEMQREYQLPGMDLIGGLNPSAITPKLNSSVAHLFGRERNLAETFGAFGWDLTMEEMRRTVAWEASGGVDLIDNHAFYYSTDGKRAFESQPSEFFQNTFWPRFHQYADYVGRLTEPARGATPVNPVGVLYPSSSVMATGTPWDVRGFAGNGSALGPVDASWTGTSNALLQGQLDFDYLDELALAGDEDLGVDLEVSKGDLVLRDQHWQTLVMPRADVLSLEALDTIEQMVHSGGTVVAVDGLPSKEADGRDAQLRTRLEALFGTDPLHAQKSQKDHGSGGRAVFLPDRSELADVVRERVTPGVTLAPETSAVRVRHVRRGGDDAFLVVNLSDKSVRTTADFDVAGVPELWNLDTGDRRVAPVYSKSDDSTAVDLDLDPYEAVWVTFRPGAHAPGRTPHLTATNAAEVTEVTDDLRTTLVVEEPGTVYAVGSLGDRQYAAQAEVTDPMEPIALGGDWDFRFDADGASTVTRPLRSWTDLDPDFSGSGAYTREVEVPADFLADGRRIRLDLGDVRELAAVSVNGDAPTPLDARPYVVDVTDRLHPGSNTIEVTVTNTRTNQLEHSPRASGLLGPVKLQPVRVVSLDLQEGAEVTSYELSVDPARTTVLPGGTASVRARIDGVAPDTLAGTLATQAPDGWTVQPASAPVALDSDGRRVSHEVPLDVSVPAGTAEGSYEVTVSFSTDGGEPVSRTVTVRVSNAFASWEFDTPGDTEGWSAGNQVSELTVSDGVLGFSATGGDPYVVGPNVDVDLAGGAVVEITMDSSVSGQGQLFWATTDGGFAESRSGRFDTVAGTGTYRVPIPAQAAGLRQLRLDPLSGTGDLAVQAIRVLPAG